MQENRDACLADGFDDFLTKPINLQELQQALERCLYSSQGRRNATARHARALGGSALIVFFARKNSRIRSTSSANADRKARPEGLSFTKPASISHARPFLFTFTQPMTSAPHRSGSA